VELLYVIAVTTNAIKLIEDKIMGDMGEMWDDQKKISKTKRANNRERSKELLIEKNINFDEHNDGAHFVIFHKEIVVDFWPGTGKFIPRKTNLEGRGVFNLLKYLNSK